ncbi:hypothetical protein [Bradyrhizobium sp. MOS002]|uniref:hypothetical protein n=1 Tax=Bradyrhizobium sp. MOS002 TaxID=2133947 RepID=UPI0013049E3F|nr:hypothetical protein [Bradyrhizobium sp. MOS002]
MSDDEYKNWLRENGAEPAEIEEPAIVRTLPRWAWGIGLMVAAKMIHHVWVALGG